MRVEYSGFPQSCRRTSSQGKSAIKNSEQWAILVSQTQCQHSGPWYSRLFLQDIAKVHIHLPEEVLEQVLCVPHHPALSTS
jgi:hypothetical protein